MTRLMFFLLMGFSLTVIMACSDHGHSHGNCPDKEGSHNNCEPEVKPHQHDSIN